MNLDNVWHWVVTSGSIVATVVTIGVAVLIACCLGCARCPCQEKDDLFKHHGV